ncbi:MAG: hypothetical protein RLZ29_978, partial [Actinomycetota bacterium]
VGARQVEKLRTEYALGCARFINMDVRPVGADNRLGLLQQRCEGKHIGTRTPVHKERAHITRKEIVECRFGATRELILTVSKRMTSIRACDGIDDEGMGASGVV